MRVSIFFAAFTILAAATTGCKSSSADAPATFCDTACLTDTIRYTGDHKLAPFIYISTKTVNRKTSSAATKPWDLYSIQVLALKT